MNAVHRAAGLTPRQAEIARWIETFMLEHQYPPTVREIGTQFEIASPNGVACHLKALKQKGVIDWTPGDNRTIRFLNLPHCACCGKTLVEHRTESPRRKSAGRMQTRKNKSRSR